MNKLPKCPYKSKNTSKCSHKFCGIKRNKKRICIFNNQLKCPLFCEWLEEWSQNQEKYQEEGLK